MNGAFLIVEAGEILTHGGMRIQKNENNKKSVTFNGVNQYFAIGHQGGQCIDDPEKCNLGIAISFTIKFNELKDNTYIYTNCGNQPDSSGYAIYYKNERMYFKVSTRTREWTVFVDDLKTSQYYDILMSWSVQFGLNLYIDYKKVAETTSYLMRNVKNPKICDLYVGRPQSDGEYANMVLEYWHILLASREILISVGYIIGE